MFIGLITSIVTASYHTKGVSLSKQKSITQPTLIKLQPNEYSQGLHYYPSAVILDICTERCNTLDDVSIKI